jgi:hypothetical protein
MSGRPMAGRDVAGDASFTVDRVLAGCLSASMFCSDHVFSGGQFRYLAVVFSRKIVSGSLAGPSKWWKFESIRVHVP